MRLGNDAESCLLVESLLLVLCHVERCQSAYELRGFADGEVSSLSFVLDGCDSVVVVVGGSSRPGQIYFCLLAFLSTKRTSPSGSMTILAMLAWSSSIDPMIDADQTTHTFLKCGGCALSAPRKQDRRQRGRQGNTTVTTSGDLWSLVPPTAGGCRRGGAGTGRASDVTTALMGEKHSI